MASNRAANTQADAANRASEVQRDMFAQTQHNLAPWIQAGTLSLNELMTRMGISGGMSQPGGSGVGGAGGTWDERGNFIPGPGGGQNAYSNFYTRGAVPGTGLVGGNPNDPNFGQLTHQFGLQDFQESPAYQFNLQQGKMALDKASAARGKFYAPSTLQDIAKFSQGMASNEYQNAFSNYQTNMGNIWNRLNSLSSGGQNAAANLGGFGTTVGSQIGQNITGAGNAQAAGQVGVGNALIGGANNYMNSQMWQQMLQGQQQGSVGNNPQYMEMPQ